LKFKYYLGVIVIVILISVVISCEKDEEKQDIIIPPDAQAGSIYLEPDIYHVNEKQYKSHRGVIVVLENRDNPESRLIEVPIIQVHATGDSVAEPIFYLTGGPGNSNVRSYLLVNDFSENHDIILVGYRGVDGSVALDCPEVDDFFSDLPGDLTEQATIDSMAAAYSRCAGRLQKEDVDTDGYTMTEVIQDFEDTRLAIGYNRINLLSSSYGTRLSMIYGWMYPKSIRRSAMISVNPPGRFEWRPEVMDELIEYYSDLYKKDAEQGGRTENLAETIRKAAHNMPERWLFFPIKKGHVLIGTFMMLYHTDTAPDIFDAWVAAGEGDWSGIALLSLAVDFMLEGATIWGDQAAKAVSADYVFEPGSNPLAEFMPSNSIIGAPGQFPESQRQKAGPLNSLRIHYERFSILTCRPC